MHGSVAGGPWKDHPLKKVTSAPGKWLTGAVPVNGAKSTAPLLEFVVNDGGSNWDKPAAGGNYTITAPGTYTLRHGSLSRLAAVPPAVMIVSDLDGTMIGDDAATAAFKDWWENEGVLRGGLLVYNTGRDPQGLVASPGFGWNVTAVREAAYAALAKVGKEAMHFRPPDEQNDHKVTCGVNVAVLPQVLDQLQAALAAAGVQLNVITSGTGDWRFLDLVPIKAGKLEALEYVRKTHSFSHAATVACGDSGNDILMLSGKNLAIVVGNAQPDLVKWLEKHVQDESPLQGKQRLLKTNKHEAYGILEGLQYFGYK
eukprot:gene9256-9422_t